MYAPNDNVTPRQPLLMRILVRPFVYRHHPKVWGGVCLAAGTWVLVLGVILCSVGFWWGALLVAVAAREDPTRPLASTVASRRSWASSAK
jgi:hypothetical protein